MPAQYSFTFTYDDLVELTGLSKNMIYQYRVREDLNPESLESLMMFCARHARVDVKARMVAYAVGTGLSEKVGRVKKGGNRS